MVEKCCFYCGHYRLNDGCCYCDNGTGVSVKTDYVYGSDSQGIIETAFEDGEPSEVIDENYEDFYSPDILEEYDFNKLSHKMKEKIIEVFSDYLFKKKQDDIENINNALYTYFMKKFENAPTNIHKIFINNPMEFYCSNFWK